MQRLTDKVVLVTGAGGGIGRAMCVGLVQQRADVITRGYRRQSGPAQVASGAVSNAARRMAWMRSKTGGCE